MSFCWDEDSAGNIIFYNFRDVESGFDGFIEFSYVTEYLTFQYHDMTCTDTLRTSMTAQATIYDVDGNETGTEQGSESATVDPVYVDTQVTLRTTETRIPESYESWPWGSPPAGFAAGDYIYLVWEVRSRINDNSQMYDFKLSDSFVYEELEAARGGEYFPVPEDSIFPVAVRFGGESGYTMMTYDPATGQYSATQAEQPTCGLRYDYILTAMRKDFWSEMTHWKIVNTLDVTLDPTDEIDPDDTASYKRTFTWNKPVFDGGGVGGSGNGGLFKWADGAYRNQANHASWPRVQLENLGMVAGYYSRYDMDKLADGVVQYLDNLDYAIGADSYALKWSLDPDWYAKAQAAITSIGTFEEVPEYADPSTDPRCQQYYYYRSPIYVEFTDETFHLYDEYYGYSETENEHYVPLGAGDYQIDYIGYAFNAYDLAYNPRTAKFDKSTAARYWNVWEAETPGQRPASREEELTASHKETVRLLLTYDKVNWVAAADYDPQAGEWFNVDESLVSISGHRITMQQEGCLGYKYISYHTHYYFRFATVPNIRIKRTDTVLGQIRPGRLDEQGNTIDKTDSLGVDNGCTLKVWAVNDGIQKIDMYGHDADYIRVIQRNSNLTKDVVATANVTRQKLFTITWRVEMEETAISEDGTTYLTQNGGVFYDLLPLGSSLDPGSVAVRSENGDVHPSAIHVEQYPNYKETGCELIKVRVTEPGDYYQLYYDSVHPYESIRDYGNLVYNPIAYETGNDDIKYGQENSDADKLIAGTSNDAGVVPQHMSAEHSALMTDLPSEATGERFIYAEKNFDIAAITAAATGLSKRVKTVKTSTYTFEAFTPAGQDYSYRLRYQNSFVNETKNLVFFDQIEEFDVDENDEVAAEFGVRNIPTILFIKGGKVVDKFVGAAPKSVLDEKFRALL